MSERTCGWCLADITSKRSDAKYCCIQHKKNDASRRHRERNPTYYRDLNRTPARAAYLQAWREANAKKIRAYAREQQARYRVEHPDAAREWWTANPTKHRLYQAQRRFRQGVGPGVTERDWTRLVRRYDGRCAYCGTTCDPHMDHVIPLKRGGRHSIGNVLPACVSCNSSKSARLLAAWKHGR